MQKPQGSSKDRREIVKPAAGKCTHIQERQLYHNFYCISFQFLQAKPLKVYNVFVTTLLVFVSSMGMVNFEWRHLETAHTTQTIQTVRLSTLSQAFEYLKPSQALPLNRHKIKQQQVWSVTNAYAFLLLSMAGFF